MIRLFIEFNAFFDLLVDCWHSQAVQTAMNEVSLGSDCCRLCRVRSVISGPPGIPKFVCWLGKNYYGCLICEVLAIRCEVRVFFLDTSARTCNSRLDGLYASKTVRAG